MIKFYTDGAFDTLSGIGAFCVVVAQDDEKAAWYTGQTLNGKGSVDPELAGLVSAAQKAIEYHPDETILYCDNMAAIKTVRNLWPKLRIEHIKGHQGADTEDTKRHHWADRMAGAELNKALAIRKTVAYTNETKET